MATIILLIFSNIFMTFAWYGHLKYQNVPLWKVTLVSWGLAFFEYCFQVPANRIGSHTFNPAQLKTIQEIITLVVFSFFSIWYLREDIKWNYAVGFFFIVVATFFIFKKWVENPRSPKDEPQSSTVLSFVFNYLQDKLCYTDLTVQP